MHGSGNDFIIIDDRRKKFPLKDISLIKNLTSRSEGIGSDGLILLQDSKDCDLKMRFFNPDGLEQDMCGNGLRCISKLANILNICGNEIFVETNCGSIESKIKNNMVKLIFKFNFKTKLDISLNNELKFDFCNSGVSHAVFWEENIHFDNFNIFCRKIRYHDFFKPNGTNVNIVRRASKDKLFIRTYERGVEEETLSCGTGALATAIIAQEKNICNFPVKVIPKSNDCLIVDKIEDKITLEGSVFFDYEGIWKNGNWYKSWVK